MKMFASWLLELTKLVVMHPEAIFSNEVTEHFNMFGPLIKDWIEGNV